MMIRGENEERNPGLPVLPVNPSRLLVVNASKINSHPTSPSRVRKRSIPGQPASEDR
ncbi:hypothetical protein ASPTUDRAFT_689531 [Aspergillus tubingensis CBS 134.48]|uniref:Uncharacterized protein n=1 Tax=Aspergillus tubingensis (strain CBS 134.48) TaxID=767770 RepID=A0A1L9N0H1_ASPTC|nr:hypothetical protein ASPTUDRAFT_689531 [Aspergillus tubingensis CBS 134.48]